MINHIIECDWWGTKIKGAGLIEEACRSTHIEWAVHANSTLRGIARSEGARKNIVTRGMRNPAWEG